MKKTLIKKITCLAVLGAALAWASGTARAQVTTNFFTFSGSADGLTYPGGWALQGDGSGYDPAVDNTGDGGGSYNFYQDLSAGDQLDIWSYWLGNNGWPYIWNSSSNANVLDYVDMTIYTNISFDVLWDTANSTISIADFNDEAFAGGNGDWGMEFVCVDGSGQTWVNVKTFQIPAAASSGWQHVNIPIPTGLSIDQTVGFAFKKWTGSGYTGIASWWIDNIAAERPGAPPQSPTLSPPAPVGAQGLNIYDDGNSGDRQSVATVVAGSPDLNYSWKGSANPVTYSVDIAQAPAASYTGYQVHIMIIPGDSITDLAPDWNQANALVLFIQRQPNGSVVGNLRYKLNQANNNTWLYGSDTNVFGPNPSHPATNTIVPTYGGLLGSVTNASGYVGTWSVTIDSSGNITLASPGSTNTCAFPSGDDAAFVSPVTVYWGTQPDNNGFYQDVVLSGVHINGSLNSLNVNLVNASLPSSLVARYSSSSSVFETPADAVYWLQWTLPDAGYGLESASSLMGSWAPVTGPPVTTTNYVNTFDTSGSFTATRNYNPPPLWIGYDSGDDASPTVTWASGSTYDAGNSASSGSAKLSWTWAGGSGNEAFTFDVFGSAQDLSGGTLSFDIMIDPSSTAGTNGDYGTFSVATRAQDYTWNGTSEYTPLLTAAGGNVGQWANVSIDLGTGVDSSVRALTLQIANDGNITGTQTIYIDNLQLTTSPGTAVTKYNIGGKRSLYITSPMLQPDSGARFFRLSN